MRKRCGVRPTVAMAIVAVCGAVGSAPALGQIVPPTPPQPAKPEPYVPPPPPPPPQVRPTNPGRSPGSATTYNVPNLPYASMLKRAEDNKVVRLDGQLDIIALRHNPMVGDKTKARVEPLVREWVEKTDNLVIENLDLVLEIQDGLFQKLDFQQQDQVMIANEAMKALITVGGLSDYLFKNKAITRVQRDFNQKIKQEYVQACSVEELEVIQKAAGEDKRKFFLDGARQTFTLLCTDAMFSFRRQLDEVAHDLDGVLADASITLDSLGDAAEHFKAAKGAATKEDRVSAMIEGLKKLTFEQQESIMLAGLKRREGKPIGGLDEIATKPDGAEPKEPTDEEFAGG